MDSSFHRWLRCKYSALWLQWEDCGTNQFSFWGSKILEFESRTCLWKQDEGARRGTIQAVGNTWWAIQTVIMTDAQVEALLNLQILIPLCHLSIESSKFCKSVVASCCWSYERYKQDNLIMDSMVVGDVGPHALRFASITWVSIFISGTLKLLCCATRFFSICRWGVFGWSELCFCEVFIPTWLKSLLVESWSLMKELFCQTSPSCPRLETSVLCQ